MSVPNESAVLELRQLLFENDRQLGEVFRRDDEGKNYTARELVELGAAANSGAIGNLRCAVRAILEGTIPNGPTVAVQVASAVRGLMRDNPEMKEETNGYLLQLIEDLITKSQDEVAQQIEVREQRRIGGQIELELMKTGGVYVYSYPHYMMHPTKEEPVRHMLKVGMTTADLKSRIAKQRTKTGMPEDPQIVRGYRSRTLAPKEMEEKFKRVLVAAGAHFRGAETGAEWYVTHWDLLDALANEFGFEIIDVGSSI